MAGEVGLIARLQTQVDEQSVDRAREQVERTMEQDVDVPIHTDNPARHRAKYDENPKMFGKNKPGPSPGVRKAGRLAKKAGGMAKRGVRFGAHALGARALSDMGIPTTVPSTDVPGMFGLGSGGDDDDDLTDRIRRQGKTGGDSNPAGGSAEAGGLNEEVLPILEEQLVTQKEMLDVLEDPDAGSGMGTARPTGGSGGGDGAGDGIFETIAGIGLWEGTKRFGSKALSKGGGLLSKLKGKGGGGLLSGLIAARDAPGHFMNGEPGKGTWDIMRGGAVGTGAMAGMGMGAALGPLGMIAGGAVGAMAGDKGMEKYRELLGSTLNPMEDDPTVEEGTEADDDPTIKNIPDNPYTAVQDQIAEQGINERGQIDNPAKMAKLVRMVQTGQKSAEQAVADEFDTSDDENKDTKDTSEESNDDGEAMGMRAIVKEFGSFEAYIKSLKAENSDDSTEGPDGGSETESGDNPAKENRDEEPTNKVTVDVTNNFDGSDNMDSISVEQKVKEAVEQALGDANVGPTATSY